jgi:TonB family protein
MPKHALASLLMVIGLVWGVLAQDEKPGAQQVPPDSAQTLLVNRVAPIYPPLARQARIQGTVVLDVIINKAGEVTKLQLVSGHPMLAPAAVDAVKQWRYRPYEKDGEPVNIETTVQVNFKLADSPPVQGVVGDAPGGLPPGAIGSISRDSDPVNVCEDSGDNSIPRRVRVSQGVMQGLLISKQPPVYPEDARAAHIQGTVLMAMEISRQGSVCSIVLISGHPLLAAAAIDAVKQWKYRPYLLNDQPVEVETQAQVNFTLKP